MEGFNEDINVTMPDTTSKLHLMVTGSYCTLADMLQCLVLSQWLQLIGCRGLTEIDYFSITV